MTLYNTYPPAPGRDEQLGWNKLAIASLATILGSFMLGILVIIVGIVVIFATASTSACGCNGDQSYAQGAALGSIAGIVVFVSAIVSVILGHFGLSWRHLGERGRGMAIAGLIIGYFILGMNVISLVLNLILR